jgi:hypothetical protein
VDQQITIAILVALVVFGAAFTQCLSGIGFGMVGMALLTLFLPVEFAIPFVALTAFFTIAYILFRTRAETSVKDSLPIIGAALPGVVVGVFVTRMIEVSQVRLIIGVTIVIFALFSLFFRKIKIPIGRRWGVAFGFVGGMLEGGLNIGGPPVVIFLSLIGASKETMKSTLLFYLFCLGIIKITLFSFSQMITWSILLYAFLLIPVILVAGQLGHATFKKISPQGFFKVVNVLLILSGLINIFKSL